MLAGARGASVLERAHHMRLRPPVGRVPFIVRASPALVSSVERESLDLPCTICALGSPLSGVHLSILDRVCYDPPR